MTTHSLRLAIVLRPEDSAFSGSDYWLRMEQITGSDIAEPAEFAEIVDELYGIEACSPEPTPEEEPPPITWERLLEISKRRLDLEECRRLASGTYTARVKLIYSHPGDPNHRPKLSVTVGRIVSRQMISEEISQTLSVREQKNLDLDYPVLQEEDQEWPGRAKWLGSVFNDESGAISPPHITGSGNRLAWPTVATGTILVKYATTYELVTIEVPGIPRLGSLKGDTQDTLLRAFWRYQVYEQEITAVANDTSADGQTLAQLCGWDSYQAGEDATDEQGGSSDGDQGDDGGSDGGGPEMGCLSHSPQLADREYFKQVCCAYPPGVLSDCASFATGKPHHDIPSDEQARIKKASRGHVEFVAVGPGPDGCGRLITDIVVNRKNCCADVEPMQQHPDNPTTISSGGSVWLAVLGGKPGVAWKWEASGGLVFDNGSSQKISSAHAERVFAPAATCPRSVVRVDDTCTILTMSLESGTEPFSLELLTDDGDVMNRATVLITGGVPPYYLVTTGNHTRFANGEKHITLGTGGGVDIFIDREQLCDGDFQVNGSDACADSDNTIVPVADIPLGIACVKKYTKSINYTQWLFDCPAEPPIWIAYDGVQRANPSYYYVAWNLPQMREMKEIVANAGSCLATYAYQLEIVLGVYQNQPAWEIRKNVLINKRAVAAFCDQCR